MNQAWLPAILHPVERAPARQSQIDAETRRLALYYLPLCRYCMRVRWAVWRLNLRIELRNVATDTQLAGELRAGGGNPQLPCLQIRHPDYTEWLYESDDIISYLKVRFTR